MPCIVEYQFVLDHLRAQGLQCVYHNSGAFAFAVEIVTQSRGWIGPPDPTIKPAAMALARSIMPPHAENLAKLAMQAWNDLLPGRAWVMPKSHWAYELQFGSRDWMPELLQKMGLDPVMLAARNNAAAIEFDSHEIETFGYFIEQLLRCLHGSDFLMAFPGRNAICTIHHHQQLWWTTSDAEVALGLERMIADGAAENTEQKI